MQLNKRHFRLKVIVAIAIVILLIISALPLTKIIIQKLAKKTVVIGLLVEAPSSEDCVIAGTELALKKINEYLLAKKADFKVSLIIEHAGKTSETAVEGFKKLYKKGIKIVNAYIVSQQVSAILSIPEAKDILIIAPISTVPSLAKRDNLFRTSPNTKKETKALAYRLGIDGKKALVIFHIDDLYGNEFADWIKRQFNKIGSFTDDVSYLPDKSNINTAIQELRNIVSKSAAEYGKNKVAIVVVGYEDLADTFKDIANDEILTSVNWYGTYGFALSAKLLSNPEAAKFCNSVGLTCSIFHIEAKGFEDINDEIAKKTGRESNDYATLSYDTLWLAALTYEKTGTKADIKELIETFPLVAKDYRGASGWTILNRFGDRKYGAYAFWQVQKDKDRQYKWVEVFWYNG